MRGECVPGAPPGSFCDAIESAAGRNTDLSEDSKVSTTCSTCTFHFDSCEYVCQEGFQYGSGDKLRVCQTNGSFDGTPLTCTPITCNPIIGYSPTDGATVAQCGVDGTFGQQPLRCEPPTCNAPAQQFPEIGLELVPDQPNCSAATPVGT
eukprot:gene7033-6677_t